MLLQLLLLPLVLLLLLLMVFKPLVWCNLLLLLLSIALPLLLLSSSRWQICRRGGGPLARDDAPDHLSIEAHADGLPTGEGLMEGSYKSYRSYT